MTRPAACQCLPSSRSPQFAALRFNQKGQTISFRVFTTVLFATRSQSQREFFAAAFVCLKIEFPSHMQISCGMTQICNTLWQDCKKKM
jgi:hypothetical protein